MKEWFPNKKSIILFFLSSSLSWIIVGLVYNKVTVGKLILIGFGAGFVFTIFYIIGKWQNFLTKKDLIQDYEKNPYFKKLNFKVSGDKILGRIKKYDIELAVNIKEEHETCFDLCIKLNKDIYNNELLKNSLGKLEYELNGNYLFIKNWKPNLWSYKDFKKVLTKILGILVKLEKINGT